MQVIGYFRDAHLRIPQQDFRFLHIPFADDLGSCFPGLFFNQVAQVMGVKVQFIRNVLNGQLLFRFPGGNP